MDYQRTSNDLKKKADPNDSSGENTPDSIKTSRTEGTFGSIDGGHNYRTLNRWQTALTFITNEVGIGILSLPSALQTLGLIPGIIAIVGMGILTTYTAYVLIQFYRAYPHVVNIVDCGRIVGGKPVEWIVAIAFILNLCLTCASAGLTMAITLNTMTEHALCTVGFIAFPIIDCWMLCIPRKFSFIAKIGIPCTISVIAAGLIVMISLGVSGPTVLPGGSNAYTVLYGTRPSIRTTSSLPPGFRNEIVLFGNPTFQEGLTACLNIAFAYAGNQGFASVMSEMSDPSRDFVPALYYLQSFAITTYTVIAAVSYSLAGQHTSSPALGSAPALPAKIAYGILSPCLLGTGLVFGHTAIKYLYVLTMRHIIKSRHGLTTHNAQTWTIWLVWGTVFWIVAFSLANAIPVFDSILNVSSALFVSWFTFGISGVFWLHLNWTKQWGYGWRKTSLAALNWFIIAITLFMNLAGMWASIDGLMNIFRNDGNNINGAVTCADNSIF